jgi:hypothetical protein
MAVSPATPEYLKWSKVPITFDRSDQPDFVPKQGWYPLIVSPTVKDVRLNRVLIDGGSSLNVLFLNTFYDMGLSRSLMWPNQAPFHGIVLGVAGSPVSQISLDEDINTLATIIPSIEILGPITQSRAQQLNHQANSFLCSSAYNIET